MKSTTNKVLFGKSHGCQCLRNKYHEAKKACTLSKTSENRKRRLCASITYKLILSREISITISKLKIENKMRNLTINDPNTYYKSLKPHIEENDMPPLEDVLTFFKNLNEITVEESEIGINLDIVDVNTQNILNVTITEE